MPRNLTGDKVADEHDASGLDEFAPRRQRVTKDASASPVAAGWSVDKRPKVTSGDRPDRFVVGDDGEEKLIAFVESGPFASFFQHWVATAQGRRAYVCLGTGCPLCARGDRPKSADYFNVIEMSDEPKLLLWQCSADPATAIKERADAKRTSPLNKSGQYFAVSKRKGKNGFNTYSVDPVKADELAEDWGLEGPLSDVQIKEFASKAATADIVRVNTKAELQQIAEEHFTD